MVAATFEPVTPCIPSKRCQAYTSHYNITNLPTTHLATSAPCISRNPPRMSHPNIHQFTRLHLLHEHDILLYYFTKQVHKLKQHQVNYINTQHNSPLGPVATPNMDKSSSEGVGLSHGLIPATRQNQSPVPRGPKQHIQHLLSIQTTGCCYPIQGLLGQPKPSSMFYFHHTPTSSSQGWSITEHLTN